MKNNIHKNERYFLACELHGCRRNIHSLISVLKNNEDKVFAQKYKCSICNETWHGSCFENWRVKKETIDEESVSHIVTKYGRYKKCGKYYEAE